MRTFLVILILAAFIQSAFIPLNLVLVLMICRSFLVEEKDNYWLDFIAGISLGILTAINLGFWALYLLLVTKIVYLIRKIPFMHNFFTIVPITLVFCLIASFLEKIFFTQTVNFTKIIIESVISLPILLLLKIWEERFVVKRDTKLRLRR